MSNIARFSLNISMAALIAGCGGSQPPIGAPGATLQGGTALARTHRASGSYQVLYRFDKPDGWNAGSLFDVNGMLYGTAFQGGDKGCIKGHGCGTVYSVSTQGVEKLLFAFPWGGGGNPLDGLTAVKGVLYGATARSGGGGGGTVYSVTTSGSETPLYNFGGMPNGELPSTRLVNVKGTLYGLTTHGGRRAPSCDRTGCGIAYSIDTSGNEKILYKFQGGADGVYPNSLVYANGMLYGTTLFGGTTGYCARFLIHGCGTFFSLSLSGTHTVLYSFSASSGSDGIFPEGQPIDVQGTFYGTTLYGGSGSGIVYSISTSGAEKVLYSFGGSGDGHNPQAGLISVKGLLYGTTYAGGDSACGGALPGCGTVYSVTTSGAESVLYRFAGGSDGMHPGGSLVYVKGTVYGTTSEGGGGDLRGHQGAACCGTIFALTP